MALGNPSEYNQSSDTYVPAPVVKKNRKRLVILVIISLLILLTLGGVLYFSNKTKKDNNKESNTPNLTDGISNDSGNPDDTAALIAEVKKIMLLPDEEPILATVNDLDKVKNQNFFAKAELGDRVLIYMAEKKAILYRPSAKMIIEVGRVNDQMSEGQVAGDNISVSEPTPIPETTGLLPKVTPSATPKVTKILSPTPTGVDFSTEY